jgi:hypothetical protein
MAQSVQYERGLDWRCFERLMQSICSSSRILTFLFLFVLSPSFPLLFLSSFALESVYSLSHSFSFPDLSFYPVLERSCSRCPLLLRPLISGALAVCSVIIILGFCISQRGLSVLHHDRYHFTVRSQQHCHERCIIPAMSSSLIRRGEVAG